MAPRRDVRHAAWRTAPAVACGRRAWRRTRHLATKAARQSRGQTFLQACAALEPGTAQDRHRSVAQLSGGKSGDPGTCEREARVRQSGRPNEQPRREQPPTNARTRASHARLSRPETHTEISLVLRADQATLRAQAASAARFTLSQTARGAIRCLARTHRSHPTSVLRVLRDAFSCRLSASVSTSLQSRRDFSPAYMSFSFNRIRPW